MDRFFAHVRVARTRPGEVLPYMPWMTANKWRAFQVLGLVAHMRLGEYVLTATGYRQAWRGFPIGGAEIAITPVGEVMHANG